MTEFSNATITDVCCLKLMFIFSGSVMFPYGPLFFFLSTLEILDKKHTFSATTWKKTFHSFKISPIWSKSVANLSRICMDNFENPRISRFSWHVRAILNQSWWTRPRMGAKLAGYSNSWGVNTPNPPVLAGGLHPPGPPALRDYLPNHSLVDASFKSCNYFYGTVNESTIHPFSTEGWTRPKFTTTVKINMFSWLFCELCCLCSCKWIISSIKSNLDYYYLLSLEESDTSLGLVSVMLCEKSAFIP